MDMNNMPSGEEMECSRCGEDYFMSYGPSGGEYCDSCSDKLRGDCDEDDDDYYDDCCEWCIVDDCKDFDCDCDCHSVDKS